MRKKLNVLFLAAAMIISLTMHSCRETEETPDEMTPVYDETNERQQMDDAGAMETDDHM